MSQQYRTPQQPPAQGGWGPGPAGPQFRQPAKSAKTQWIVMGSAVLAVLLIAVGVVLLVSNGDKDQVAAPTGGDTVTPDPIGTLYTPATPTKPVNTKGPYDVGVEVGKGVWFTPAKGWLRGPDKTISGQYWMMQEFNHRGLIDGYFWVRQTQLYDAKSFAEHLVDIESNGFLNVRIGKGVVVNCQNEALKACYAINYSADVPSRSGKGKPLPFRGFVTAFEDKFGQVTATDAGLETRIYKRRLNQLIAMNKSVEKSYS